MSAAAWPWEWELCVRTVSSVKCCGGGHTSSLDVGLHDCSWELQHLSLVAFWRPVDGHSASLQILPYPQGSRSLDVLNCFFSNLTVISLSIWGIIQGWWEIHEITWTAYLTAKNQKRKKKTEAISGTVISIKIGAVLVRKYIRIKLFSFRHTLGSSILEMIPRLFKKFTNSYSVLSPPLSHHHCYHHHHHHQNMTLTLLLVQQPSSETGVTPPCVSASPF